MPKQLKAEGTGAKLPAKSKEDKSLAKPYTVDEVRDVIKGTLHFPCDPDYILKKLPRNSMFGSMLQTKKPRRQRRT